MGVQYQNVGVMLLGTGVGGTGFGTVFFETLRSALPYAQPGERAGLLSAYFVEGYLSLRLPALAAGFLAPIVGLTRTADFYGIGSHPAGNHSPAITLCRAGAQGQLQRWSTDGPIRRSAASATRTRVSEVFGSRASLFRGLASPQLAGSVQARRRQRKGGQWEPDPGGLFSSEQLVQRMKEAATRGGTKSRRTEK